MIGAFILAFLVIVPSRVVAMDLDWSSDKIILSPENTEKEIYEPLVRYISMESVPDASNIAQVMDISIGETDSIRVGLTSDYADAKYGIVDKPLVTSVAEDEEVIDTLSFEDILSKKDEAIDEIRREEEERIRAEEEARRLAEEEARRLAEEEARRLAEEERIRAEKAEEEARRLAAEKAKSLVTTSLSQGGLFDIDNPDPDYTTVVVNITGEDREILERLVMGEAGDQGFKGAALVAQCLKDMYIKGHYKTIDAVRRNTGYTGSLKREPNKNVLDAVAYVFDAGGYAVKHRILYFYAPSLCTSKWHETQNFIIEYKDHRVFDEKE